MRGYNLILGVCLLMAVATGAEPAQAPGQTLNLSEHVSQLPGTWQLTLPVGAKYQAVLRRLDEMRFRLEKAVRFSGEYEIRNNRLVLVKSPSPRDAGFAWELSATGELTLVAEPENLGVSYLGAKLTQTSKVVPPEPKVARGAPEGTRPAPRDQRPALDLGQHASRLPGNWQLTLPAGAQYQVVLRQVDNQHYRLEKAVRFSGEYEIRGNRLVLVKAAQPPEAGFEWELHAPDELVLVAQGPKLGSNYLGAVLKQEEAFQSASTATQDAASPAAPAQRSWFYLTIALGVGVVVLSLLLLVVCLTRAKRTPPNARKSRVEETSGRIAVTCRACLKSLKTRVDLAGKKVRCPECGEAVMVPQLTEEG